MSEDRPDGQPEIDMTGTQKGPETSAEAPEASKPEQEAPEALQPEQEAAGGKSDAGAQKGSEQEQGFGRTAGDSADERAAGDMDAAQQREQIFTLYQESLDSADWAYKVKSGPERDIGHKSVILAERAYVSAGLYDKEEADKMYEAATGRPPKPELQQRIADAQGVDPAKGIADLTAGLSTLQEKQKLWSMTLNKNQIEKQMSNWEVAIGDAQERKRNHQRQASEELLKPEALSQNDESGLGMFLRSLKNGYKAGKDLKMGSAHGKRQAQLEGNISGSLAEHGDLVKKIAEFTQEQGPGMDPTSGPVGKNAQRFAGAMGLVNSVLSGVGRMAKGNEPEKGPSKEAETPGVGPADLAKRSSIAAAMAKGQGQGIGM